MRIAHIGFEERYTEGATEQDNLLTEQHLRDGHEVLFVSDETTILNGEIVHLGFQDKYLPNGMHLVRIPYDRIINRFLSEKIRKVSGLKELLTEFDPDIIFSHCLGQLATLDLIEYKKQHPRVLFYADTHAAAYNSGTNWLSLHVLHRGLYRWIAKRAYPYLERYYYIGKGEHDFAVENYDAPEDLMEFYPLGGKIFSEEDYQLLRAHGRDELGLTEKDLLFLHTGKLYPAKKTEDLLKAFSAVSDLEATLVIIGSIPEEMKPVLLPLIASDKRVMFLGWKNSDEMFKYLAACDIYLQPGSVSSTCQNAICLNCAIVSYPHDTYLPFHSPKSYDNFIWVKDQNDMEHLFRDISSGKIGRDRIETMKRNSAQCAGELLDYKMLAARLYRKEER